MDKEIQDLLNDLPNKKFSKFSDKQLQGYENLYGLKRSESTKLKMSEAQKNKIYHEDSKLKMSISAKKRPSNNKGKKFSDEIKEKLSLSHKGKKFSDETKKKMSNSRLKNKDKFYKKILCYTYPDMKYHNEYENSYIASKELNLMQSCISLTCTEKRKSTGGYTFRYKD